MSFKQQKDRFLLMKKDEKRKYYIAEHLVIDNILTWQDFANNHMSFNKYKNNSVYHKTRVDLNKKVSLFYGDITTLEIDAIVNSTNKSLNRGSNVQESIFNAANSKLLQSECRSLDLIDSGECKITGGYQLPAKYIIHTVGPFREDNKCLKNCYKNALNLLEENGLKSIAFPCISTSNFCFSNENAAHIAISSIREWLLSKSYSNRVERIIFCVFLKIDIKLYQKCMLKYFPVK